MNSIYEHKVQILSGDYRTTNIKRTQRSNLVPLSRYNHTLNRTSKPVVKVKPRMAEIDKTFKLQRSPKLVEDHKIEIAIVTQHKAYTERTSPRLDKNSAR